MAVVIHALERADWPVVWPVLRDTFGAGDRYAFAPDSSEAEIPTSARCGRGRRLGFAVAGTLPGAFRHARRGYVDALVMYKRLAE